MSSVSRACCCGVLVLSVNCSFDASGIGPELALDAAPRDGAAAFDDGGSAPDATVLDASAPDAVAPDASGPPLGYVWVDGEPAYYRAVTTARSMAAAAMDCDDDGAGTHLLVIDSDAENEAVRAYADDTIDGRRIWLGISDLEDEGTWLTLDLQPLAYDHWNGGEPNDLGDEDCAELLGADDPPGQRGRWNDLDCEDERPYLCEWSPG